MNDQETIQEAPLFPNRKYQRLKAAILLLILLTVWAVFARWTVNRTDLEMRAELLQQTRIVAQAIDVARIQSLMGTEDDLNNPHYLRIKEQLSAVRLGNPKCRFIYLMGRKFDGTIFFFVDSERVGSQDYSPPGQVYTEAPAVYRNVFVTEAETVVGPSTDRWGVWVSGLVPIYDPRTRTLLAVLGIDLDAHAWKRNVTARVVMPVGMMLVMLIGVFAVCCPLPR